MGPKGLNPVSTLNLNLNTFYMPAKKATLLLNMQIGN